MTTRELQGTRYNLTLAGYQALAGCAHIGEECPDRCYCTCRECHPMTAEPTLELLAPDGSPGETLRDHAIAAVEAAADPDERARIDNVIEEWARSGLPWSLNDIRPQLAGIRGSLMGARVHTAARRGLIVDTKERVKSTLPSTHAAELKVWIGAL